MKRRDFLKISATLPAMGPFNYGNFQEVELKAEPPKPKVELPFRTGYFIKGAGIGEHRLVEFKTPSFHVEQIPYHTLGSQQQYFLNGRSYWGDLRTSIVYDPYDEIELNPNIKLINNYFLRTFDLNNTGFNYFEQIDFNILLKSKDGTKSLFTVEKAFPISVNYSHSIDAICAPVELDITWKFNALVATEYAK